MYDKAVNTYFSAIEYVPDRLKQFVVKPPKYSMDIYKSVEIIILTVTKNPEMLQFASHQFKTKIICKYAVKGFIFRNKI